VAIVTSSLQMSIAALRCLADSNTTTDIPTASAALGIGSNLGYQLAAKGEFPVRVLRLGRKLRVPTADLLVALGVSATAPSDSS
jgi:hypothetical protein